MQPSKFLKNKIVRQLKCNGVDYVFNVKKENEFHELIDDEQITIKGIYHEQNSFETETHGDGNITHTKKSPMILCLLEDAKDIKSGDSVIINDKIYNVTSLVDIQNYKVACDISLEEVI